MPEPNRVKWVGIRRVDPYEILYTAEEPSATGTTGQVPIGTSADQIVAADPTRQSLLIINHGAINAYIGTSSAVSANTGILLSPLSGMILRRYTGALFGETASGSTTIGYFSLP